MRRKAVIRVFSRSKGEEVEDQYCRGKEEVYGSFYLRYQGLAFVTGEMIR